jgi:hypothetical protein
LKTWWGDEEVQIVAVQSYDVVMLQAGKSSFPPVQNQRSRQE